MKTFFIIIITSLFVLTSYQVKASHAAGAELRYECLGSNQYRFIYTLYSDCSGISINDPVYMDIQSSCFFVGSYPLNSPVLINDNITRICSLDSSTCHRGYYLGIRKFEYSTVVTLPGYCDDWIFSLTENARTLNITTTMGPGVDKLCVFATLNNTIAMCNSSPVFEFEPTVIASNLTQQCISNAATDPDGDSLTFELIPPHRTIDSTVTYLNGYTYSHPLFSNPPITLDASTGLMCMHPSQIESTIYAVLVSEFRNGVLIGKTERDIQLISANSYNHLPEISGINGTSQQNITACPGQLLNFLIFMTDADSGDSTTLIYDTLYGGATLDTSGTLGNSVLFSWTPSLSDVRINPYCINVQVSDNHCPFTGSATKTFCITVLPDSDASCQTTKVHELNQNIQLKIFPNPAHERVNIDSKFIGDLSIYDSKGVIIYETHSIKNEVTNIDVSHFAKGIYQVVINSEFLRSKGRFIVE